MPTVFDRRDFARLSSAAFGGMMVGASARGQAPAPVEPPTTKAGASDADKKVDRDKSPGAIEKAKGKPKPDDEKPKEIHICRGLNSCKNQGASGDNKCAGQGTCATTLFAPHECATGNACRGQGGCGKFAGRNKCAGYGDGAVPLTEEDWPRLRREFEARMKRLNIPFGPAPPSQLEIESDRRKAEADAKWLAEIEAKKAEAAKNRERRHNSADKNDKTADKNAKDALEELTRDRNRPRPSDQNPPK